MSTPYLESAGGMWDLLASVSTEDLPPAGGACAEVDPELFFPVSYVPSHQITTAKQICAGCPVLAECREYGMGQFDGIFGGLTPGDRRRVRQQQERERRELERHTSITTTDSDHFAMGA
uniref:4Fe-4S Wbl-type domain-containing protein n=1 Tax=Streptomyces sp. 44030 TaxID=364102 RepID=Q2LEX6_9ACTN|nr:WhiB family transcriptional regulator [Streptomyces sp. 44030]ABC67339.1 hypothetical protein pRL1.10 [Streptomyces sp. 44030]